MTWTVLNLCLALLFVLAMSGIPLWMVLAHPDTAPDYSKLPAWYTQRAVRPATIPDTIPAHAVPEHAAATAHASPAPATVPQPAAATAAA